MESPCRVTFHASPKLLSSRNAWNILCKNIRLCVAPSYDGQNLEGRTVNSHLLKNPKQPDFNIDRVVRLVELLREEFSESFNLKISHSSSLWNSKVNFNKFKATR